MLAGALSMLRLRTGRPGLVPTPDEAQAYPFSAVERDFIESWLANVVHGDPQTVRAGLDALVARTGADELVITANAHTPGGPAALVRPHRRRLRVPQGHRRRLTAVSVRPWSNSGPDHRALVNPGLKPLVTPLTSGFAMGGERGADRPAGRIGLVQAWFRPLTCT